MKKSEIYFPSSSIVNEKGVNYIDVIDHFSSTEIAIMLEIVFCKHEFEQFFKEDQMMICMYCDTTTQIPEQDQLIKELAK